MARGPLYMTIGKPLTVPVDGDTAIFADADGAIKQLHDDGTESALYGQVPGEVSAQAEGMDPSGLTDAAPRLQEIIDEVGAAGGGVVKLGRGTPAFATQIEIPTGVEIEGAGFQATRPINACAGDLFVADSVHSWAIRKMTIDAPSVRSAGLALVVRGGDSSVRLATYGISRSQSTFDVDMNNQYDGVKLEDVDAGGGNIYGPWGTSIGNPGRLALWRNFAAGRFPFNCDAPHGASLLLNSIFIVGNATPASGPQGFRVRGCGDIIIRGLSTWGTLNGLLIDPAGIGAETVMAVKCSDSYFDFASGACFRFNPGVGVAVAIEGEFSNVWFASSIASHAVHGSGGAAHMVRFNGGSMLNAAAYGLRGDTGCTSTTFAATAVNFGPPLPNASGDTSYV